mgnify:CR=1 FL=1
MSLNGLRNDLVLDCHHLYFASQIFDKLLFTLSVSYPHRLPTTFSVSLYASFLLFGNLAFLCRRLPFLVSFTS